MIRLSIHLFTILTKIIQVSVRYKKKILGVFRSRSSEKNSLGVGVGVKRKFFSGVGVGVGMKKVDSAVHYSTYI